MSQLNPSKTMKPVRVRYLLLAVSLLMVGLSLCNGGRTSSVSNNGGKYLIEATKISKGNPPDMYDRGPVFTTLLSLAFLIGGTNFTFAHWVAQSTYVAAILSATWLAKLLYGRWVALVTGILLALSSKLFLLGWRIGLDFLMAAFICLSCIFYIRGGRSHQRRFFALSGICYGLAFLTKEAAVFYLPFPLLISM